jgi:hypothetical protein
MSRLADRWSLMFLPITVVLATAACTGDPIRWLWCSSGGGDAMSADTAVPSVALVQGLSRAALVF